ncbi:MAG: 6-phosphofructokinase [Candidatus Omnitrophica bacterium]|nr:6-phosphofructokinase [Candidatus Omnitrophota bacterium]
MKRRAAIFQSGGSTPVINQSLAGVIEEARKSNQFAQVLGARFGILGVIKENFINLSSLSKTSLERLKNSPSSALGSCRYKLSHREVGMIVRKLRKKKIDVLFFIGGNDSAKTGLALAEASSELNHPLQVIGIPKTIDNDLPGMDHAPGYGSVARFMAITTQEASLDTKAIRSSDPIKIIETMGRNSGWIVAAASLGKKRPEDGPHLLYFPERAFHHAQFLEDVHAVYKRYGFAVVVISETIRDQKGERIGSSKKAISKDQFGHRYVEGTAHSLCNFLESKLKVRARFDKPGTIQRMSIPYISITDQREAYGCGVQAVRFALQGKTGIEVAIKRISHSPYRINFQAISLEMVAGCEKKLPDEFINREGNFTTPQFRKYALPLIGSSLPDYLSFV